MVGREQLEPGWQQKSMTALSVVGATMGATTVPGATAVTVPVWVTVPGATVLDTGPLAVTATAVSESEVPSCTFAKSRLSEVSLITGAPVRPPPALTTLLSVWPAAMAWFDARTT